MLYCCQIWDAPSSLVTASPSSSSLSTCIMEPWGLLTSSASVVDDDTPLSIIGSVPFRTSHLVISGLSSTSSHSRKLNKLCTGRWTLYWRFLWPASVWSCILHSFSDLYGWHNSNYTAGTQFYFSVRGKRPLWLQLGCVSVLMTCNSFLYYLIAIFHDVPRQNVKHVRDRPTFYTLDGPSAFFRQQNWYVSGLCTNLIEQEDSS